VTGLALAGHALRDLRLVNSFTKRFATIEVLTQRPSLAPLEAIKMRFNGLALIASAAVLGACGGGDKTAAKPADTATTAAPSPTTVTPPTTAAGAVAKKPATGKTVEVKMIGDGTTYRFEPANITIKAGDNIKWVMVSGGPHNVSFNAAEVPAAAKAQLSANMDNQMSELMGPLMQNANESYEISFAGIPAGTYNFYCTPHLAMNMKGTITVTP
jgi:plastocyanin